jgi:hypothetical protein
MVTETDVSDVVKLDRNSGNKITGSESARLLRWKIRSMNVLLDKTCSYFCFKAIRRAQSRRNQIDQLQVLFCWTNWGWKTELTKRYQIICLAEEV